MKTIYVCIICGIVDSCSVGDVIKHCHEDCDRKCTEGGDACDIHSTVCARCLVDKDWRI